MFSKLYKRWLREELITKIALKFPYRCEKCDRAGETDITVFEDGNYQQPTAEQDVWFAASYQCPSCGFEGTTGAFDLSIIRNGYDLTGEYTLIKRIVRARAKPIRTDF